MTDQQHHDADPDWTARELKDDLLVGSGWATLDFPYIKPHLTDSRIEVSLTFSKQMENVLVGLTWIEGDAEVGVAANLSPDDARTLAHDLEQAALRAGGDDE